MPLGAFYRHRRFTGALALLGMAFYVVLLPWHTLSQTTLQLSQTSAVAPPCPHAMVGEGSKIPKPEKPRTHCPICNGLAPLQTAVSVPATPFLLRIVEGDVEHTACEDRVAKSPAPIPQSRGPPFSV
jgi:hypothetical protein